MIVININNPQKAEIFSPKSRVFSPEELKPQPTIRKRCKVREASRKDLGPRIFKDPIFAKEKM